MRTPQNFKNMKITARKRRNAISKGIARICSHCIEWHFNDRDIELSGIDMEYITNSLINNGIEGELYTITPDGKTVCGWWNIQW
jgi:hypothetical protein